MKQRQRSKRTSQLPMLPVADAPADPCSRSHNEPLNQSHVQPLNQTLAQPHGLVRAEEENTALQPGSNVGPCTEQRAETTGEGNGVRSTPPLSPALSRGAEASATVTTTTWSQPPGLGVWTLPPGLSLSPALPAASSTVHSPVAFRTSAAAGPPTTGPAEQEASTEASDVSTQLSPPPPPLAFGLRHQKQRQRLEECTSCGRTFHCDALPRCELHRVSRVYVSSTGFLEFM